MVISNKPLQFIIAILIACLPIFGFSNTPTEGQPVHTETTAVDHEAVPVVEEETSEIKKQIKDRLSPYSTNGIDKINDVDIIAKVEKCTVGIITYEEWIELFNDTKIKETLSLRISAASKIC